MCGTHEQLFIIRTQLILHGLEYYCQLAGVSLSSRLYCTMSFGVNFYRSQIICYIVVLKVLKFLILSTLLYNK